MRKIIISIIIGLLTIGVLVLMIKGVDAAKITGIIGIKEKNAEIDSDISNLATIISVNYSNALSNLKKTANTLIQSKTEYENQAILTNSNVSSYASQRESYDIDYLWTRLGDYASEENVIIKIEVTTGEESSTLYNLNFTVTGDYLDITQYIYDIENDSKLGFKIDNFKMEMNGDTLVGRFTCKDISINISGIDDTQDKVEESTQNTNTTNTNSNTNTTNTKSNSNTNTTNTKSNTNTTNTNSTNNTNTNSSNIKSNTTSN